LSSQRGVNIELIIKGYPQVIKRGNGQATNIHYPLYFFFKANVICKLEDFHGHHAMLRKSLEPKLIGMMPETGQPMGQRFPGSDVVSCGENSGTHDEDPSEDARL